MATRRCRCTSSAPMRWSTISPNCRRLFPVWCLEILGVFVAGPRRAVEIEQNRFHEALRREGLLVAAGKHGRDRLIDLALVEDEDGAHQIAILGLDHELPPI